MPTDWSLYFTPVVPRVRLMAGVVFVSLPFHASFKEGAEFLSARFVMVLPRCPKPTF